MINAKICIQILMKHKNVGKITLNNIFNAEELITSGHSASETLPLDILIEM